jgi:raffinose/stachyose/melibiose transport system permease protein
MGLPAAILFAGFYFVPFIANLRYSLTKWDRITEPEFVGLRNFVNLLTNDDLFYKVLGNNLRFTFLVVVFQTLFSLIFALFLVKNSKANIALRTLFFFPTILSSVSVGMIWLFMYDPNFGAVNLFFTRIGLENFALNWLGSESSALIFSMTQGGPNNSSNIFAVLIYQTVFSELRIGYAATQSIFFILVLVFVTVLQRKFLNSRYEK